MEELRSILLAHARRYPAMAPQDGVKLVYQNGFGGGHLVTDPAQSLERLPPPWRRTSATAWCGSCWPGWTRRTTLWIS